MIIDADFPGGNIVVEGIDGSTARVHQDLRTTQIPWFYWYFRVRPEGASDLTFTFTESEAIGVRGPAVSIDGGASWRWLGTEQVDGQTFRYRVSAGLDEIRFSFGMPYQHADLVEFIERLDGHPNVASSQLDRSEHDRPIELLRVGRLDGSPMHRVLLTSRHHACEMLTSYSLEGLVDFVLAETAEGAWLRDNVEFVIVPMVDVDGVEEGDQGKRRSPHDHNEDYAPHVQLFRATRAVSSIARELPREPWALALDLHCPAIAGPEHEVIYFVGTPDERNWARVVEFSQVLEQVQRGPLPFRAADNMPFGSGWNVIDDPDLLTFAEFMDAVPGTGPHATVELPYANAAGAEVNAGTAREFGRDLARAIRAHLQGSGAPSGASVRA